MSQTKHPLIAIEALPSGFEFLAKASGAENLIFMLRDAFPAKKQIASRTSGYCLAQHMIVTALLCDILHGSSVVNSRNMRDWVVLIFWLRIYSLRIIRVWDCRK